MDFKGSLIDEHDLLSSWKGQDCCSWYGITCHNYTGFVQMINLGNHYPAVLRGRINSSLVNLKHLEYLDLNNNNFSEIPFPAFLGSLSNLQYLDLNVAGFSGEIPPEIGNLSNLHHLSLGQDAYVINVGGSFYSFMSSKNLNWIVGLTSLTSLQLSGIDISGSDDWFDSINKLSSLSSLKISNCGLVGMALPHDLNLTSLVSLDLSFNNFNSPLNPSLFNLSSLEDIDISNGTLSGPIPNMFQKLTSLNRIDLSSNFFGSSLPDSLCALTGLAMLDLSRSELHGFLPFCLGNLTNLTSLRLVDNQFSGRIPSTLAKLTKLQLFDISSNSLVGELTESFFEGLKNLVNLMISDNEFIVFNVSSQWIPTFQIQDIGIDSVYIGLRTPFPSWLQSQTSIVSLSLRNISISGAIPNWCSASCPQLYSFDLSNNFLTGHIPIFDANDTFEYLDLSNNQFSGRIPDELCNLHSMNVLKLANNQLTGRIPNCLGNLQRLQVLYLANNSFSGHIPNELGYLNRLIILHLNMNKLSGELPSSFQNLTSLMTLDLGKNELHGFIPNWIGKDFVSLQHLMLQSNKFSGEIPMNLCQLPSLRILNLPDNSLVGTIPHCLGNLSVMLSNDSTAFMLYDPLLTITSKGIQLEYSSNLKYAKFISLSQNHLHGEIPEELMNLIGLQSLNLSHNELIGNIPERIGNMKHLESLDLSTNHLSGTIPQSLADIDALSYLKLSFNNLSGRIPSGNHFNTFDNPSNYEGNDELCGKPATKSCDDDDSVPSKQNRLVSNGDEDSEIEFEWFYAGIGPGFAVGFLGVFFLLYFKSSRR